MSEPTEKTEQPEQVEPEPDIREEILEATAHTRTPFSIRRVAEPIIEGIKPLEPLKPISDYADQIVDALNPSHIMPPLMPEHTQSPSVRLYGYVKKPVSMVFKCPYGFDGLCCGCRYMPCNELTVAVLAHVTRDFESGGRCSAD